ncbi:hypothetical protein SV7mr_02880 [Stieleria bergensis]|uniref:Uncharacterized protein n=1 Tax=Stieleria bergensis TaxID=2528025 RepID=A0A517SNV3_9BACT|nr:hypothetical protein SV7mr_02880 [Planctomycetes bacterium SV_7m_r]
MGTVPDVKPLFMIDRTGLFPLRFLAKTTTSPHSQYPANLPTNRKQ